MSIKIRLSRGGRRGVPFYKIVVANSTSPRDGKFIEKLGIHNPSLAKDNKDRTIIAKERAEYWLGVGATPSDRVAMMLIALGVKGADKYKPKFTPKKKGDGAKKKALENAAKAKEAAEAAAAKDAEPKEEVAAA
jgi:small subunit ribosomal protein S16